MKIWIIGGTADSSILEKAISSCKSFADCSFDYIISVTTPEAKNLYSDLQKISIGKMNQLQMEKFCQTHRIAIIVDASHPFAVEVSQNAIATAKNLHLSYLRFEREKLPANNLNQKNSSKNTQLESFDQLLDGNYLSNHRVLLTVGCQILPRFKPWQSQATLFARVLPKLDSLKIALDSGFSSDRLIALRPPYSAELETALWQKWQISLVVTKASGQAGGEDRKRKVAQLLSIPLVTINRPKLAYPRVITKISAVITLIETFSKSRSLSN